MRYPRESKTITETVVNSSVLPCAHGSLVHLGLDKLVYSLKTKSADVKVEYVM